MTYVRSRMNQSSLLLQGHVECEGPNNKIYKFHGNLKVGKDQLVPIEPEQILLRGARLRNTNHVHGMN